MGGKTSFLRFHIKAWLIDNTLHDGFFFLYEITSFYDLSAVLCGRLETQDNHRNKIFIWIKETYIRYRNVTNGIAFSLYPIINSASRNL